MKPRLPVILLLLLVCGCAALPASVLDSDAISELAVAVSLAFGILFATLITLIVIPVLLGTR